MKFFLKLFIKISISVLLLIFLFNRIDFKKIFLCIRTADVLSLGFGFLLFILVILMALIRWIILLRTLKKGISFSRIFSSYSGGLFFNLFLPSAIGGDITRIIDLSAHTKDTSSIFATVLLDRLFGCVGLVLVALVGFLYAYFIGLACDLKLLFFILLVLIIMAPFILTLFNKKIFNFINKILFFKILQDFSAKFHNSCYRFRFEKKALLNSILLSVALQAVYAIVSYFIGRSLGITINIIYYLIFVPIINTITILPISIGGLGLRDNAAIVLFSALGVSSDKIAAMTLINFGFIFFIGIIGGIIYGIALYNRRIQRH